MKVASAGKYNVVGLDNTTQQIVYPFYHGFNTKEEATKMTRALNNMDDRRSYIVINNK